MGKRQVSGYSDGPGWARCKTVGLAYVGSNPTPATQNPRSGAVPVFPDAGSDVCSGSGSVDRSRLLWASGGPDLAWSAAHGGTGARDRSSGAVIHRTDLPVDISAGHWRVTGSGRRFRSSCVPLSPAAARTHDGRDSRRLRRFLWASGGPADGAEGLLDLLAGIWSQPGTSQESDPADHLVSGGPLVVVSCSSFALMSARSVTLATFPTWVRGSAPMSSRRSGHLYLARPSASR
jgi:hypothetical protein